MDPPASQGKLRCLRAVGACLSRSAQAAVCVHPGGGTRCCCADVKRLFWGRGSEEDRQREGAGPQVRSEAFSYHAPSVLWGRLGGDDL